MKNLTWQHVIVVLGALGVLGALSFFEKDTAAVITGVLAVLGVLGFVAHQQAELKQTAAKIEQNTNGTNSELLRIIDRLQREKTELALKVPTDPVEGTQKAPTEWLGP